MKHCIWFIFLVGMFGAKAQTSKQFIPNPAFQFTTNELAFNRALRKLGYESIMLVPANKIKEVMGKISRDTSTTKIDGWDLWRDLGAKLAYPRQKGRIRSEGSFARLNLARAQYFGTSLNAPLVAGKTYKLTFQFLHLDTIHALPADQVPQLGFAFLPASPTEGRVSPDCRHRFKQNKDAKDFARRKAILRDFEREYGGNYAGKDWQEFQGNRLPKDKYTTITLTYRAQGGEQYLVFGNFRAKTGKANPPNVMLTCYRIYLHDASAPNTIED